jgi:hypothetical protein
VFVTSSTQAVASDQEPAFGVRKLTDNLAMVVSEPDVRKALVRFREGWGGNLRGAPHLLD